MADCDGIEVFSLLMNNYSTEVKNEWVKVVNEVNKLINESKSKMDT